MIHPLISAAARAVTALGWRITSIVRPDSTSHGGGYAFDTSPWHFANHGFGFNTARVVLRGIRQAVGPTAQQIIAVSERDHVHVELLPHGETDAIGVWHPSGITEIIPMDELPDGPIGDPFSEDGDALETGHFRRLTGIPGSTAASYLDFFNREVGDALETGDYSDALEQGAIRLFGRKKKKAKPKATAAVVKALASPHLPTRAAAQGAARQIAADPEGMRMLSMIRTIRDATTSVRVPFIGARDGATLISTTLGPGERLLMRPADANALMAALFGFNSPPFEPQAFSFTPTGVNNDLVLDVDQVLSAVLPIGTNYAWTGLFVDINVPLLSKESAKPFTVAILTDAGETVVHTFRTQDAQRAIQLFLINSKLAGGVPRLLVKPTAIVAVATGTKRITIAGLNSGAFTAYNATGRFFQSGDTETEALLHELTP